MDQIVTQAKDKMQKALEVLKVDLGTIRSGRATPALVENIAVSVYGGSAVMKIMELATINVSDTQTLLITPFDRSIVGEVNKGLQEANIGLNPAVDGQNIRINIPPLSQERRDQLISLMRQKLENGKIAIRQIRHEAMNDIKKANLSEDEQGRLEKDVQKLTDNINTQIDFLGKQKESELSQI